MKEKTKQTIFEFSVSSFILMIISIVFQIIVIVFSQIPEYPLRIWILILANAMFFTGIVTWFATAGTSKDRKVKG